MDYRIKNNVFHLIEKTPCPHTLHYLLQKYVTRSVDRTDSQRLSMYRDKVQCHLDAFSTLGGRPLTQSTYYEFGSGWDLFAPLGFSAAGMQSLICVDIHDHIHVRDIVRAARFYRQNASQLGIKQIEDAPLPSGNAALRRSLEQRYRIRYEAPCDARKTGLPAGSVDYIVSNCTLEHIGTQDIPPILTECSRLLRTGGILSCVIDYQDHWSYADPSIGVYHFLSYSSAEWQKYNPSLHYQNRLRHSDYMRLFEQSGLQICSVDTKEIRETDRQALDKTPLSDEFSAFSTEDILIRGAHFVLRKK